jgi:hypothetical protein
MWKGSIDPFRSASVSYLWSLCALQQLQLFLVGVVADVPSETYATVCILASDLPLQQSQSPVHLPSLQQSQSSQHEAVSFPFASFFFIGHESLPQQDIQEESELLACALANETIDRPSSADTARADTYFLFMLINLNFQNPIPHYRRNEARHIKNRRSTAL